MLAMFPFGNLNIYLVSTFDQALGQYLTYSGVLETILTGASIIFYQVREKLEETGRLWWSNSDITVAYMLYAEDHFSSRRHLFLFSLFPCLQPPWFSFLSSSPVLTILFLACG